VDVGEFHLHSLLTIIESFASLQSLRDENVLHHALTDDQ
jgi:hypothetical protein